MLFLGLRYHISPYIISAVQCTLLVHGLINCEISLSSHLSRQLAELEVCKTRGKCEMQLRKDVAGFALQNVGIKNLWWKIVSNRKF